MSEVHPDHREVYRQAMETRKEVLPILHREQQHLKSMGFATAAMSSMATGINLPGKAESDIDLVVRAPSHDIDAVSKKLGESGVRFSEKVHHYNLHTYTTPEGIPVDVKVFKPHIFDYQQDGFKRLQELPPHKKAEIIYNKNRLKDDKDAYKKYKMDVYVQHGALPRDGVYPEPEKTASAYRGFLDELVKISGIAGLPHVYRPNKYTCGPSSLLSVLRYYGIEGVSALELSREMGTTPEKGTSPLRMVRAAKSYGLKCRAGKFTIEDLGRETSEGVPVIVAFQAWPKSDSVDLSKSWDEGHYAVVTDVSGGMVYMDDPAYVDQVSKIPVGKFLSRWHDMDGAGNRLVNWGLAIYGTPSRVEVHQGSGVEVR